jgi:glutamate-1-semialdehyde 2,1-aminomutase
MKVVAIIQARIGSSRLNGKVLKPLGESSVLEYLITRLSKSSTVDEIIVATSTEEKDNEIYNLFKDTDLSVFRGSEDDVLSRYIGAAKETKADVIVRITGDCPFVDPDLVDDCVNKLINSNLDYVSNCNNLENPLPDGFDVEVFTMKSFLLLQKISITSAYKEHVTFGYFKTNLFLIDSINYDQDFSNFRLTLDYEEDFSVISKVADKMGANLWGWEEICKFLKDNKEISSLNSHIVRNASWEKSFNDENKISLSNDLNRDSAIAHSSGLLSKRADQFSPGLWPKNYIKAKGQVIWAENNQLFLDFSIGGIGATTLGYAFDYVDDRVIDAVKNGSATSLNSSLELDATKQLINAIPWIESARYTRSGGEATTLAIRLARAKTDKVKILFSGYHGWHDWYLAAAINNKLGNHLLDDLPILGVPHQLTDTSFPFDYGDCEGFSRHVNSHKGEIAAVILEPMRYTLPDKDFLSHVRKVCYENNIVMILDEISSGFRFNNNATHIDIDIIPDMVVFSKALGNGYPIACIGGNREVMGAAKDSFISSTTHTESIGFAAMSAVLDYYQENDVSSLLGERGSSIKDILHRVASNNGLDIKISGLDQLWSWSFNLDGELNRKLQTVVTEHMLIKSILFSNRFYATLGIDSDFYQIFERSLEEAFNKVSQIIKSGDDPINHIKYGLNKLGIYK